MGTVAPCLLLSSVCGGPSCRVQRFLTSSMGLLRLFPPIPTRQPAGGKMQQGHPVRDGGVLQREQCESNFAQSNSAVDDSKLTLSVWILTRALRR